MKDIEFIQKCIPFCPDFTLCHNPENVWNVPVIYIESNGYSKRYILREKTFQNFIFPHFLTRTIEGINRNNIAYRIEQAHNMIEVLNSEEYDVIVAFEFENMPVDDCKRAAIEYVLDRL